MSYIGNTPTAVPLTSADITDGIITSAKIANDAVVTGKIADGTIASADLASNAVDTQALSLFNATGSAPVYACRAWVNFDGTGTPAIREDGNVSSITDNGTGQYTVNFATAMPDTNFCHVSGCQSEVSRSLTVSSSGSCNVNTEDDFFNNEDSASVFVAVFR